MNQQNLNKHWKKIFSHQQTDFRSKNINSLILGMLSKDKNTKILDLGCGTCGLTLMLIKEGYKNITSVDSSKDMIKMAQKYFKTQGINYSHLFKKGINDLSKQTEKFDTIICLDVLEHVQNDNQAAENILKLINKGGKLILSVPALPALYGPKDKKIGHYRRYSKNMLLKLFSKGNIKIKQLRYWNFIGVIPTYMSLKLNSKAINEDFRYSQNSWKNTLLNFWFKNIENNINFPIGLSLIIELSV